MSSFISYLRVKFQDPKFLLILVIILFVTLAVIIVTLAIIVLILYIMYRREKKKTEEFENPDFEKLNEQLPISTYEDMLKTDPAFKTCYDEYIKTHDIKGKDMLDIYEEISGDCGESSGAIAFIAPENIKKFVEHKDEIFKKIDELFSNDSIRKIIKLVYYYELYILDQKSLYNTEKEYRDEMKKIIISDPDFKTTVIGKDLWAIFRQMMASDYEHIIIDENDIDIQESIKIYANIWSIMFSLNNNIPTILSSEIKSDLTRLVTLFLGTKIQNQILANFINEVHPMGELSSD
jgi:hypothetical protein